MFYIQQNEKIVLFDENLETLQSTLVFMPQYQGLEIVETDRPIVDFQFADTEEYIAEQTQKEKERIANLFLTGADVERGIYQAKGMDFDDILAFVMANPPVGLDVKALKIELKANNFYRGNPYVEAIGTLLGFTTEQLNAFFETNDYTVLLPSVVEDNLLVENEQELPANEIVDSEDPIEEVE